jgi:hypothetical protein
MCYLFHLVLEVKIQHLCEYFLREISVKKKMHLWGSGTALLNLLVGFRVHCEI